MRHKIKFIITIGATAACLITTGFVQNHTVDNYLYGFLTALYTFLWLPLLWHKNWFNE